MRASGDMEAAWLRPIRSQGERPIKGERAGAIAIMLSCYGGNEMSSENTKLIVPALGGLYSSLSGLTEPLFRIVVGALLIPHGMQKVFGALGGGGISGTAGFLEKMGYSNVTLWATLIALIEFFGGIALVLGLLTRPVAAAAAIFMANAVLFHSANGYFWTKAGFEYPLLWGVCFLILAIRGGGAYSLDAKIGKEF